MQVCFARSFPKTLEFPNSNEDCFCVRENRRVVLCDGASESFDAQTWAQLLAEQFANEPLITVEWVERAAVTYRSKFETGALSWAKQAAFERGSFSTLLAIECAEEDQAINILAVGDSTAFLVEDGAIKASWPYTDPQQFSERPVLLSTNSELNGFVADPDFDLTHRTRWDIGGLNNPLILCVTDAVGQWILQLVRDNDRSWEQLLTMRSLDELGYLVLSERNAKRMRVDDSTVIVLKPSSGDVRQQ